MRMRCLQEAERGQRKSPSPPPAPLGPILVYFSPASLIRPEVPEVQWHRVGGEAQGGRGAVTAERRFEEPCERKWLQRRPGHPGQERRRQAGEVSRWRSALQAEGGSGRPGREEP